MDDRRRQERTPFSSEERASGFIGESYGLTAPAAGTVRRSAGKGGRMSDDEGERMSL